MNKIVTLHGGPWHGQRVEVPYGSDHVHVRGIAVASIRLLAEDAEGESRQIPYREGTYSQVAGLTHDFEWDGWVSHE